MGIRIITGTAVPRHGAIEHSRPTSDRATGPPQSAQAGRHADPWSALNSVRAGEGWACCSPLRYGPSGPRGDMNSACEFVRTVCSRPDHSAPFAGFEASGTQRRPCGVIGVAEPDWLHLYVPIHSQICPGVFDCLGHVSGKVQDSNASGTELRRSTGPR